MPPGNDVVDFLLRRQISAGREWTVVQKRDGIFAVLLLQPEQVAHRLNGDEDTRVGAIVSVLPDFAQHPDNFEAHAIQQDGRAYGWPPGKYVFQQLPANHGNSARFGIVFVIEPATGTNGNISNLVVLGDNAKNLSVGGTII